MSGEVVEELLVERGVEVDQHGQVIDVLVSARRDAEVARPTTVDSNTGYDHAFIQNLRRGHYELGHEVPPALLVAAAFTQLAGAI